MIAESGFRLDTGPTVLTMPDLLAQVFAAAGADMADFVTIDPVDPMYRACFADGSTLFVRHGRQAMTDEIRRFAGDAGSAGVRSVLRLARAPVPRRDGALHRRELRLGARPRQAVACRPAARALGGVRHARAARCASFFEDERLQRIFSFQSMYAGLAPYEALSLYAVITYMDTVQGVFAPRGGMHAMASGLAAAVQKAGATIRYDSPVGSIVRDSNGRVTGVDLDGGERLGRRRRGLQRRPARRVSHVARRCSSAARRRRGTYSPSCLLWVAGVRGLPPAERDPPQHPLRPRLGRVVPRTHPRRRAHARSVDLGHACTRSTTRRSRRMAAPRCMRSSRCPTWTGESTGTVERDQIVQSLQARVAGLGYPTEVMVERTYDPLDWQRLGMERGTPFALAHTLAADRSVSPEQHRPARAGAGLRRVVHGARCRGSDGARVRQVGRTARRPVRAGPSMIDDPPVAAPDPATPPTLEASYDYCRQLNKRHGTTYYAGTYALPAIKRHHVHALYAFCRSADDIVDDLGPASVDERTAELDAFGDRFFTDLRRRLVHRPGVEGGRPHGARVRHRPRLLPSIPALDEVGSGRRLDTTRGTTCWCTWMGRRR